MKIGIIAEGSYPFIRGGVAGWIHMLVAGLPNIEFEIISLMPDSFHEDTNYKYELPPNVNKVWLYKLGVSKEGVAAETKLTPEEAAKLTEWFQFHTVEGAALEILGDASRLGAAEKFFNSKHFWDIVTASYEEEEQASSFLNYFWMYRSMNSHIIALLQHDFPKVDLVHSASTGYAGLIGAYMQQTQNIPYLLTEHGIYSREREEEVLRASWIPNVYKKRWIQYFHHLSRQAYAAATDVITLFERNGFYQEELGAPKEKLKIIPNGIHYERLSQVTRVSPTETLQIGAIVRIVPIKDIKTMLYAARILADEQIDFQLQIMGPLDEDPEYAQECFDLLERLGIEQYVTFTGQVNIVEYLPRFDLLLLTSISEGQPLAVLEGMAAGIPWITTDVGSCSELLFGRDDDSFGQAGFVVPPVNAKAIAEKCKWFAENREAAVQYGQNGRKRAEKYYQLSQVIDIYQALYEERGRVRGWNRV